MFSLRIPEADDGLGLGMTEAVLVFEELGRNLVPGPLVATELVARTRAGAAAGSEIVGVLQVDPDELALLEHPDDLDALLVLDSDGARIVAPSLITSEAVSRPLDALTPVSLVTGSLPAGESLGGPEVSRAPRSRRPCAHVRVAARHRGAHGRARHGVREGTRAVQPSDRFVPDDQAHDRRHARAGRGGARRGTTRRRVPSTGRATRIRIEPSRSPR